MQWSDEEKLVSWAGLDCPEEAEISRDLYSHLKITGHLQDDAEFQDSGEDEDDEEFSFICGETSTSPIAAEDAFANGQIRPVFPFYGRDWLMSGEGSAGLGEGLPLNPLVRKIFVETEESDGGCGRLGIDEVANPACEWSRRKAVEASPAEVQQVCKKSNSTGFSKIWRFKEFVGLRSNSDGRDAFVFLKDGGHAAEDKTDPAGAKSKKEAMMGRKGAKTGPMSAHESYLKSKAKEERRRSYLPYRPELVGFFTNVNGGLTKNVHPF